MYRLVEGPDGRVLKDLYFVKNPRRSDEGVFLMSEEYQDMLFIYQYGSGWDVKNRKEIYNDLTPILVQVENDIGKEAYSRLTKGWWYGWSAPLAKGYRLIKADNFLIGEL